MGDNFIGEIRIMGFDYAPMDWALCNGQEVPIAQYQALYSIIGIRYGGDGKNTFGLPNLQGQVPMGTGSGPGLTPRRIDAMAGEESVRLSVSEMPTHNHTVTAKMVTATIATDMTAAPVVGSSWLSRQVRVSNQTAIPGFNKNDAPNTTLSSQIIASNGSGGAHENRQPCLALNFCIALNGWYPTRPS